PAGGYLDGWIDFNGDGDWLDAGEAIFARRAVAAGDNSLTFQVPAGATSGLTYARFRLSSAGGLGPTGLASDGEVEDHAVMIGGASGLTAVESALEAYRFGNGQPRSSLGPAFYDTQGRAWYFAETYFTGLGLQALLAAPDQTAPNNFDAVQRHLSFFLNRIEADGTVRIWLLDASGNPPSQDITIKVRNPQTRQDEWRTLLKDKASLDPDADDSALASIISLAAAYQFFGGESRAGATPLLGAAGVKAKLELLADTMLSLRELNGLTRVYLTPQFAGQPVAVYLMDNLEVRNALYAIARLEREFYNDAATAAKYQAAAAALDASIATHFYDAASGTYRVLADGPVADLDVWYADSLAQIWTVTEGWLPATSPSGQTLLTKVFDRWDGSPGADWTKRGDGGAWAWAALQAGQVAKASESLVSLLPAILRNDAAYVGPIAAPDLNNGQEVPTTIADVGFALQTLLPAATNDQVSTGYEKSVDFDPRDNDFSISSRSSDLGVSIVAPPASGSLTVLADGALRYTPNAGFSGDDRLRYKVTASDGGSRAADVSIHVNHRPQLANAATISYRRGEGVKAIDSSVVVTDADNAKLASAVVSLNPFTVGADELRFTANSSTMGNISVVSNSNGVLRLASSGATASTTQWQNALRSVGYFNGGATTSAGRQATFVVNDGIDDSPPLVSTINVDTQPPTVAIEFADSRLDDARRSTVATFRFSEAVTGFTSADATTSAETLSSFVSVNASTYTATFTSNDATEGNGSVAVTGPFTDIAGNTGVGGSANIPLDTRNPTVSLTFGASSLFDGRISTSVTIQFSEPIVGFAQNDLSAGDDSLSNFAAVDADTYTATFTARDGIETTGSLQVVGEYSDLAGNIGANGSANIAIDTLNPTVSLQFADLLLYDGRRSSIVTIQFSEAVAGFVLADLSAGGDALSSFVAVDADTYRVTFTARDGVDSTGTVQLSGAYTDIEGNVGADGSANVAIDTLNPTVSLQFADTLLFDGRSSTLATMQFSEPVVGFTISDLSPGAD
ncbi:MAG TPA: Ig-like domain-containing protein, partial [Pirellulaceae bacterium]|nr:Ig-like domain-containing protein [Pirellulaceae bacterium]